MKKTALKKSLGISAVFAAGFLMVAAQVAIGSVYVPLTQEIKDGDLKGVRFVDDEYFPMNPTVQFVGAWSSSAMVTTPKANLVSGNQRLQIRTEAEAGGGEDVFNVSIAPLGEWHNGVFGPGEATYLANGDAAGDGQMTIDPSNVFDHSNFFEVDGGVECDFNASNAGSEETFSGTTSSIDLVTHSVTDVDRPLCDIYLKDKVTLQQTIPANQEPGNYNLTMEISIV